MHLYLPSEILDQIVIARHVFMVCRSTRDSFLYYISAQVHVWKI